MFIPVCMNRLHTSTCALTQVHEPAYVFEFTSTHPCALLEINRAMSPACTLHARIDNTFAACHALVRHGTNLLLQSSRQCISMSFCCHRV